MSLLEPLLRALRPAPQLCRWPEECTEVVGPNDLLCPKHQQTERDLTTAKTNPEEPQ